MGIVLGLVSVFAYTRVPAEDSSQRTAAGGGHLRKMNQALHSRSFILFLVVLGLATLGGRSVIAFVPLFMKEQVRPHRRHRRLAQHWHLYRSAAHLLFMGHGLLTGMAANR